MEKKQGRPSIPDSEKIAMNGLFQLQNKRIQSDADKNGIKFAQMLRFIVRSHYQRIDLNNEKNPGLAISAPDVQADFDKTESGYIQGTLPGT